MDADGEQDGREVEHAPIVTVQPNDSRRWLIENAGQRAGAGRADRAADAEDRRRFRWARANDLLIEAGQGVAEKAARTQLRIIQGARQAVATRLARLQYRRRREAGPATPLSGDELDGLDRSRPPL